jgi:hypothetical protein
MGTGSQRRGRGGGWHLRWGAGPGEGESRRQARPDQGRERLAGPCGLVHLVQQACRGPPPSQDDVSVHRIAERV